MKAMPAVVGETIGAGCTVKLPNVKAVMRLRRGGRRDLRLHDDRLHHDREPLPPAPGRRAPGGPARRYWNASHPALPRTAVEREGPPRPDHRRLQLLRARPVQRGLRPEERRAVTDARDEEPTHHELRAARTRAGSGPARSAAPPHARKARRAGRRRRARRWRGDGATCTYFFPGFFGSTAAPFFSGIFTSYGTSSGSPSKGTMISPTNDRWMHDSIDVPAQGGPRSPR